MTITDEQAEKYGYVAWQYDHLTIDEWDPGNVPSAELRGLVGDVRALSHDERENYIGMANAVIDAYERDRGEALSTFRDWLHTASVEAYAAHDTDPFDESLLGYTDALDVVTAHFEDVMYAGERSGAVRARRVARERLPEPFAIRAQIQEQHS